MTKVMSFDKIETKADVLKYAIEFTAENGKPNYDEARKMFEFFTSLVSLPEVKEDYKRRSRYLKRASFNKVRSDGREARRLIANQYTGVRVLPPLPSPFWGRGTLILIG